MTFSNNQDRSELTPEERKRLQEETEAKIIKDAIAGDEASNEFLGHRGIKPVIKRTTITVDELGYLVDSQD